MMLRVTSAIAVASTVFHFDNVNFTKEIKKKHKKEQHKDEKKTALRKGLDQAKLNSEEYVLRKMQEVGSPGMVVAVSIDGNVVWKQGFGYADVENKVCCTPDTLMRVASISKSFTATAMARLWEAGKLDLDKPIQAYLKDYPEKYHQDKKANITLRQLLSHMSGVRHYQRSDDVSNEKEFDVKEYYIKEHYKSVTVALDMFKDDPLIHFPGEEFLYTTHGWTLISAILEEASGREFLALMQDNFKLLGMKNTFPDYNDVLMYNRSRYYKKDKTGNLVNAPYVDNSYKWAGGGFVSTVGDLLRFGNAMLYSYQCNDMKPEITNEDKKSKEHIPGILKSDTVQMMWTPIATCKREKGSKRDERCRYGMGWEVYPAMQPLGFCPDRKLEVAHTGAAVGASSILYILPETKPHLVEDQSPSNDDNPQPISMSLCGCEVSSESENSCDSEMKLTSKKMMKKVAKPPQIKGVVVAIITNMQGVGLTSLAREIAGEFDEQLQAGDDLY